MPILQPEAESYELTAEQWEFARHTDRGEGKLGSSGK